MAAGIPDKAFFKIGEAARVVGVEPYVLRYWETEFDFLRPQKSRANQRVYTRRDVEMLLQVKRLLYKEKFTIAGARRHFKGHGEGRLDEGQLRQVVDARERMRRTLERIREEARELLRFIDVDEREP